MTFESIRLADSSKTSVNCTETLEAYCARTPVSFGSRKTAFEANVDKDVLCIKNVGLYCGDMCEQSIIYW